MLHTNSPRNILRSIFEERGGVKSHLLDNCVLFKDIPEAQEQGEVYFRRKKEIFDCTILHPEQNKDIDLMSVVIPRDFPPLTRGRGRGIKSVRRFTTRRRLLYRRQSSIALVYHVSRSRTSHIHINFSTL